MLTLNHIILKNLITKRLIYFFFLSFFLAPSLTNAQHFWMGTQDSDWHNGQNWYSYSNGGFGTVPGPLDMALVSSNTNNFPEISQDAEVLQLILSGGSLLIQSSGKLIVDGNNATTVGIVVNGISTLENSGEIEIRNIAGQGIVNTGSVFNNGNLVIEFAQRGILNDGPFKNLDFGNIQINDMSLNGIFNDGPFDNYGSLKINGTGSTGVYTYSTFVNDGFMKIENTDFYGLHVQNSSFDNLNKLIFNNCQGGILLMNSNFANDVYPASISMDIIADDGVRSINSDFHNNSNISFHNITGNGIYTDKDFINSGYIDFYISVGNEGIKNLGQFINNACAELSLRENRISNEGTFTNNGFLKTEYTGDQENIGTFENNDFIQDSNNSFANVTMTNHGIIFTSIQIEQGGTLSNPFACCDGGNTIYLNLINPQITNSANGSTVALFDPTTNTLTDNSSLAPGNYNWHVVGENSSGACIDTFILNVNILPDPSNLNNCLDFDGSTDWVIIPSPVTGAADFTFEGWIFSDETANGACGGGFNRLLVWGGNGTRFEVGECNGDGDLVIYEYNSGSQWQHSNAFLRDGNWHHVAIARSGNNIKTYVDGVLELDYTTIMSLNTWIRVGKWYTSGSTENWDGQMDDFRIWDYARTPEQIIEQMNCKLDGSEAGLLAYFPFDQGIPEGDNGSGCPSGSPCENILIDVTGNGFDGELQSFALNGTSSNWVPSGVDFAEDCDACEEEPVDCAALTIYQPVPLDIDPNNCCVEINFTNNLANDEILGLKLDNVTGGSIATAMSTVDFDINFSSTEATLTPINSTYVPQQSFQSVFTVCFDNLNQTKTFDVAWMVDSCDQEVVVCAQPFEIGCLCPDQLFEFTYDYECLEPGDSVHVTWTGGCFHPDVELSLIDMDPYVTADVFAPSTANDGSYYYVIPQGITPGNYQLYIETTGAVNNYGYDYMYGPVFQIGGCCCVDSTNVIENGGFTYGLNPGNIPSLPNSSGWGKAYWSPQFVASDGCSELGCLSMWGNQIVGEATEQIADNGVLFEAGKQYAISYCAKWVNANNMPTDLQHAYIKMRASNYQLSNTNCNSSGASYCEEIGISQQLDEDGVWESVCLAVWTADKDYDRLTISVENNSSINHGDYVSWGRVDDICIQDLGFAPIEFTYDIECVEDTISSLTITWTGGDPNELLDLYLADANSSTLIASSLPNTGTYTLTGSNSYSGIYHFEIIPQNDPNTTIVGSDFQFGTCCCLLNQNVVENGGFSTGMTPGNLPHTSNSSNWEAAYGSPQFVASQGCSELGCLSMWGNQVVGEATQQVADNGILFEKGKQYAISYCAKWVDVNDMPAGLKHAYIKLRASNYDLNNVSCTSSGTNYCDEIGISPQLNQDDVWESICLPVWTADRDYDHLTISVENNSSVNHGEYVSWGRVDDICIQDLGYAPLEFTYDIECIEETDTVITITWTGGDPNELVDLYLADANSSTLIASSLPNTGAYTWTVTNSYSGIYHFEIIPQNDPNTTIIGSDFQFGNCCCLLNLNVVENGGFSTGMTPGNLPHTSNSSNWEAAYGSPQFVASQGCSELGCLSMWGNQVVGEATQQVADNGILFEKGKQYAISYCAKWVDVNDMPAGLKHAYIKLRASNYDLNSVSCNSSGSNYCDEIGMSPQLNQDDVWESICLPVWTADQDYDHLTISVENNSSVNHGEYVSWGRVDDICIQDLGYAPLEFTYELECIYETTPSITITWTGGDPNELVDLYMYDANTGSSTAIATGVSNTGTYTWSLGSDSFNGFYYFEMIPQNDPTMAITGMEFQFGNCCCQENGNIIANGGFSTGMTPGNLPHTSNSSNWEAAYGSPQFAASQGCSEQGCLSMWGNQVVGEATQQVADNGILFEKGKQYAISYCAKWVDVNDMPDDLKHAYIKLRASNYDLNSVACNSSGTNYCDEIGISPQLNQDDVWETICLPVWVADQDYDHLTISVENNSSVNHGDYVSWGRVDDICIQDLGYAPPTFTYDFNCVNSTTSSITITWTGGNPNDLIDLGLHNLGLNSTTAIASGVPNTGSYTWSLGNTGFIGNYTFEMIAHNDPNTVIQGDDFEMKLNCSQLLVADPSQDLPTTNAINPATTGIDNNDSDLSSTGFNGKAISTDKIDINVYPNPAQDYLEVSFSTTNEQTSTLHLTDASGRVLIKEQLNFGEVQRRLDISQLQAGLYILVVQQGTKITHREKVIKQ